ncbi:hypothetical protein [Methanococcus maripaludis]|uniref:Uncharacterized protein n=2 Tax=Methanococcus maripaludis TaxID=39152 RepID=Q6LYD4_METMP|nr:hypothetical protein [Methanococcus maripaludis]MBA2846948.1 hypothetical protein [Methanococcus maripaludis]CAF30613.1 hypothetical protein MMP1057 [Methanococcus maripaludis S2]
MLNIPKNILDDIIDKIRMPEGTVVFRAHMPDLFDPKKYGVIFQATSGAHAFILEKNKDSKLNFYHSSPGVGTRVATIELNELNAKANIFCAFSWSNENIKLSFGVDSILNHAVGKLSEKQILVGKNGEIIVIDTNTNVKDLRIYDEEGNSILEPSAIIAWENNIDSINMLKTLDFKQSFMHETIFSNIIISTLVTGFEAYCKKRFLELEKEGIPVNENNLINLVFTKHEKSKRIPAKYSKEAKETGISLLEKIVLERKINFQNFDDCKKAYNKTYNLVFGTMDPEKCNISELRKFFEYRHRIIHISLAINPLKIPKKGEVPIFSNKILVDNAIIIFDSFIKELHSHTLKLKRS